MTAPSGYVFDLAQQMPVLLDEEHALDVQSIPLPNTGREYYAVKRAMHGIFLRICAVEDMILATPAVSLADVARQLLMAISKVNLASSIQDPEEVLTQVERALRSSLYVVAAATEVDLDALGFDQLAPSAVRPRKHDAGASAAGCLMTT